MSVLTNDVAEFALDGRITRITHKTGRVLLDDSLDDPPRSRHINDPRYGGGGAFGVCLGKRNQFFPDGDPYDFTWDITSKFPYDPASGYGVKQTGDNVYAYVADGVSFARVEYEYVLHARILEQTIIVHIDEPGFYKEPKVVVHSLLGYRHLSVINEAGRTIGYYDLAKLREPSKGTLQMGAPRRHAVRFSGDGLPLLAIVCDRQFERWTDDADTAEPLRPDGPSYCLKDGKLRRQWESAHRKREPYCGVMFHAWEGGYGQPDCQDCYRFTKPAVYRERLVYDLA